MSRSPSSDTAWKGFLIVLGTAMLALHIYGTTMWRRSIEPGTPGTLGVKLEQHDKAYRRAVLGLSPGSPLLPLGVKAGDKIQLDRPVDAIRYVGTDELIGMTIFAGGTAVHALVRPAPHSYLTEAPIQVRTLYIARRLSVLLILAIAFVVAWRRPEWLAVRVLMVALLCVSVDLNGQLLPAGALSECYFAISVLLFMFTYCAFLYFALAFPAETAQLRRPAVRRAFAAFVCLCTVVGLLRAADRAGIFVLDSQQIDFFLVVERLIAISSVLAGLAALWSSWRASVGTTRQRIGWLACCTGAIYLAYLITNMNALIGSPISPLTMSLIQTPMITLAYVGIAYALIRHRLFDISFAVNRALVFTIISTLLLLLFGVTEYAVDKLLHFEGREKNVIFDAAVALGIILSFHRIQHWVSHRIDHTFFHHWYAAASTLRRFIERAPHVTDADALQTKYLAAMRGFCGAADVAQYLRGDGAAYRRTHGGSALPAAIEIDSDLAIALRHERSAIDLHREAFGIDADHAFPMTLRGEVNGIIILSARADGGGYRPDEIKLLAECVRSYAADLESLRVAELERSNAQLAQHGAELQRQVELLQQASLLAAPALPG